MKFAPNLLIILLVGCGVASEQPPSGPEYVTTVRLYTLSVALNAFSQEYGRYPSGTVQEVIEALSAASDTQQNPRRIMFLSPELLDANADYVDGWGRQILMEWNSDRTGVTLRSLGQDGQRNSDDDFSTLVGLE